MHRTEQRIETMIDEAMKKTFTDGYKQGFKDQLEESARLRKLLHQALEALEETGIRWPFINQAIQDLKKELRKHEID
jgi:flagellar biosynthesis/type III secretory pathway protein FliH